MSVENQAQDHAGLTPARQPRHASWFRFLELEIGILVGLTLCLYGTRLTDLSIRGEESRRGRIAWEMVRSGDWLVPRVQGLPRLTRPPLQYWAISGIGILRGQVDAVAVRLPCVLATLLTVLLVYAHGRCWMSRAGAFSSAAMYATFAQVLQLGRLGETEAIFTFLLSAALLVWHIGVLRNWKPINIWMLAYFFAGLATLTKGPQAPLYFAGGIGVYLLLTRQWRFAVSWSHLAGVALYLTLVGAWQIPFTLALGQERVSHVYLSEVAKRFEDSHVMTFVSHLAVFPIEVWLGCLFPWSLLLLAFVRKDFRNALDRSSRPVIFLAGCIAIAFPTVWIPPEARTRYFMPLFPCFALLCGCVLEQWLRAPAASRTRFQSWAIWFAQPVRFATLAALLGLMYVGPIMSYQVARSPNANEEIAQLRQTLPADAKIYSFGVVHHLFSFLWGDEVVHREWPADGQAIDPELEYFCVDVKNSKHNPIPFEWEEVARINCDRMNRQYPQFEVLVGRRLQKVDLATNEVAGSTQAGILGNLIGGPPSTKPDFDKKTNRSLVKEKQKVLVMCYAPKQVKWDFESVDKELRVRVARLFNENEVKVLDPDAVNEWMDKHPDWDKPEEIGRDFAVDFVVYIEIRKIGLYEWGSNSLFRGNSEIDLSVFEMEKNGEGNEIYSKEVVSQFPIHEPVQTSEMSYSDFQERYLSHLSDEIGRHFYGYKEETPRVSQTLNTTRR
jgi:4-amino-4-deoxy-L-arabinose transferase-like glycosyltransferase